VNARAGAVVVMQPFSAAHAFSSLSGKSDASFFSASGPVSYEQETDQFDTLDIVLDASGRPVSGSVSGRASRFSGDYGYDGKVSAKLTFAMDVVAPEVRATANRSFASVPLPWDVRTVEISEPVEESDVAARLLGDLRKRGTASEVIESAFSPAKKRGVSFRYTDWNAASGDVLLPDVMHDLAGNALAKSKLSFEGALDVPLASDPSFRFGKPVATWGAAKVVTSGCKSSGSCLEIGPFKWNYCARGSAGGAAIRLPGSGRVTAEVRGVAKPSPSGPGYPGGVPMGAVQLGAAVAGADMKVADASTVHWPTVAGPDGSYDTGWSVLQVNSDSGSEIGVAVSGGTMGIYSSSCGFVGGGPPAPIDVDVTIYVDSIALTK
jgi:hypothetical protein